MQIHFKNQANWVKVKIKTLGHDEQGTTAIEFAILGIPFLMLLFGIVELAVLFFLSSTTQHALESVSREVRTGEFQNASGTEQEFKAAICTAMVGIGDCDNLRVDVVSSGTGMFSDLTLPVSPAPSAPCTGTAQEIKACEALPPNMPGDNYNITQKEDVVIVRVQYLHKLAVPSTLTRLSNANGNYHVITHTTAFKNEPF